MEVGSATAGDAVSLGQTGVAGLTADDFFTLLVTQLQNQDPTEPVSNEELLGQLATMRSLQSNVELGETLKSVAESVDSDRLARAAAYIGQTVALGDSSVGRVDTAFVLDGVPTVSVNGQDLALESVLGVVTPESYLGQIVTAIDSDGVTRTGHVTSIEEDNGQQILNVEHVDTDGQPVEFTADADTVQRLFTYNSLLGRSVRAIDANGRQVTGIAAPSRTPDNEPALLLDGQFVTLDRVVAVGLGEE